MGHYVYVRNKKTKPKEPGWWPEKKRMEALTTYLSTGNLRLTASMINVPLETVKSWKRMPWWSELTNEIQKDDTQELDSKLSRLLNKSIEAVNDRLENGDYQVNSNGRVTRHPAKLRDVHKITTDLIVQRQSLRKQHVEKQDAKPTNEERLLKLAEQFAQFALGKTPQPEKIVNQAIDGEFQEIMEIKDNHAIHEEREERLQEGGSVGQESQDSLEGSLHEEQSQSGGSQENGQETHTIEG